MKAEALELSGLYLLTPKVFGDARGFFMESFNQHRFNEAVDGSWQFVQDNHSRSAQGVLRGLHYQLPPHAQGKLVRVTLGAVYDVVVDIRPESASFGRWSGRLLSAENFEQLFIPPGFAHGFLTLSEYAEFLYKTTDYYHPESERCIAWNDPDLGIDWPIAGLNLNISARDLAGLALKSAF
jgi:dTDP-4-dehydrorhamnose 3,5-epimerase